MERVPTTTARFYRAAVALGVLTDHDVRRCVRAIERAGRPDLDPARVARKLKLLSAEDAARVQAHVGPRRAGGARRTAAPSAPPRRSRAPLVAAVVAGSLGLVALAVTAARGHRASAEAQVGTAAAPLATVPAPVVVRSSVDATPPWRRDVDLVFAALERLPAEPRARARELTRLREVLLRLAVDHPDVTLALGLVEAAELASARAPLSEAEERPAPAVVLAPGPLASDPPASRGGLAGGVDLGLEPPAAAAEEGREPEADTPATRPAPATDSEVREVPSPAADWAERLPALAQAYEQAPASDRPRLAGELQPLVEAAAVAARREPFAALAAVVGAIDAHPAAFRADASLGTGRDALHATYFDRALERASGPMEVLALDAWCQAQGHDDWRERVAPLVRLVSEQVGPDAGAREKARRRRSEGVARAREFAAARVVDVAGELARIVAWLAERRWAPATTRADLEALIARAVERAGEPRLAADLRSALRAVEHAEPSRPADGRRLEKELARRLDQLGARLGRRLLGAVDACIEHGEPGLGYDLLSYLLLVDPDNDQAHRGLGHVKVDGRWLRRHEAQRLRQGWAWDERLGWVRDAERARYARGEYFDLSTGAWTTLVEAERRHADPAAPWEVETEHFRLRSTADLARTAEIATRLEAFYLAMFRQFDAFFGDVGGAAVIFGRAPAQPRRMEVWFYRDRAQFLASAGGPANAAGFYDPARRTSFFFDDGTREAIATLQHEVTHQVLAETSPDRPGVPAWLAEGAAVLLESAELHDGVLTPGGIEQNAFIAGYVEDLARGAAPPLSQVLRLHSQAEWNANLGAGNYRGAGALVYFLCHFDGGRYRADLVELLRAAYEGRQVSVRDATGLTLEALDALMERFYRARS